MTAVNICIPCLKKVTRKHARAKCMNGDPCNICGLPAKGEWANTIIYYEPEYLEQEPFENLLEQDRVDYDRLHNFRMRSDCEHNNINYGFVEGGICRDCLLYLSKEKLKELEKNRSDKLYNEITVSINDIINMLKPHIRKLGFDMVEDDNHYISDMDEKEKEELFEKKFQILVEEVMKDGRKR